MTTLTSTPGSPAGAPLGTALGVGGRRDVVLVGVDGSASAGRALRWALDLARGHGLAIEVLTVAPADDDSAPERERAVLDLLTDLAPELVGVPYVVECVHGDPVQALVTASVHAAELVLGIDDDTDQDGPVTRACLARAACPVVVVDADGRLRHGATTGG